MNLQNTTNPQCSCALGNELYFLMLIITVKDYTASFVKIMPMFNNFEIVAVTLIFGLQTLT